VDEALAAAQELVVPGFGRILMAIGLDKAFNALLETERNYIVDVVLALVARGAVAPNELRSAVEECTAELEDLALDVPAAPRVLGKVMGLAAVHGLLGLDVVAGHAGAVESAEPRRAYVAEALQTVKAVKGEDGLVEAVKSSGINVEKLLESDPEFEAHLPAADAYAAEMGLSSVM
jgi:translation initiation factor 4G